MADVLGTATLTAGTGNKSINVGALLRKCTLTICGKNGGDALAHISIGTMLASGTAKVVNNATDGTNCISEAAVNSVIRIQEKVGGVWTVVFEAVPQATPFSGTNINLNVTVGTAAGNYQMVIEGET